MAFELISEAEYREIQHYKGMEVVHFGKYDWLVLKRKKDHMLLLMKDALEQRRKYHQEGQQYNTWEKCTLRKWLNEDFYNTFTSEEQARILETHLENPDNEKYETKGGNDTDDKIFLLSLDEAEEYMTQDERKAESWWWWLRSPGMDQYNAAGVHSGGAFVTLGMYVNIEFEVRPALNLKI